MLEKPIRVYKYLNDYHELKDEALVDLPLDGLM